MKIGELARAAFTNAETIRFYEREGLLPAPTRTDANYRDYGPEHIARVRFVRRARDLGFTMAQVRQLLALSDDRTRSCAAVDEVASVHLSEVTRKIAALVALRDELGRLLTNCRRGSVGDCRIVEALSG